MNPFERLVGRTAFVCLALGCSFCFGNGIPIRTIDGDQYSGGSPSHSSIPRRFAEYVVLDPLRLPPAALPGLMVAFPRRYDDVLTQLLGRVDPLGLLGAGTDAVGADVVLDPGGEYPVDDYDRKRRADKQRYLSAVGINPDLLRGTGYASEKFNRSWSLDQFSQMRLWVFDATEAFGRVCTILFVRRTDFEWKWGLVHGLLVPFPKVTRRATPIITRREVELVDSIANGLGSPVLRLGYYEHTIWANADAIVASMDFCHGKTVSQKNGVGRKTVAGKPGTVPE